MQMHGKFGGNTKFIYFIFSVGNGKEFSGEIFCIMFSKMFAFFYKRIFTNSPSLKAGIMLFNAGCNEQVLSSKL